MTIVSFIIGTLFIVSFAITEDMEIAYLGFYYLVIICSINMITFICRIIELFIKKNPIKQTLSILGIQLINIPVAAFYFYLFTLMS